MMLRKDTRIAILGVSSFVARWWHSGSTRLRLRRRLMVSAVPVALLLLIAIGKIVSTMITGQAAVSNYTRHDIDALHDNVATLETLNIIEPGEVSFIAGDLAVLEGRLDDAELQFHAALSGIGADECAARVNLELIRETQGDLAASNGDKDKAKERYTSALQVVSDAQQGCFADNGDPNPDRNRVRNDTEPRLREKITNLDLPPAAPPGPPQTVNPEPPPTSLTPTASPPPPPEGATSTPTPPPPPPPKPGEGEGPVIENGGGGDGPGVLDPVSPDRIPVSGGGSTPPHRLGVDDGSDPLDKLREVLGDADATGSSRESTSTGT